MWPINLSVRLPIVAMVGRYLTIQLIGRESILKRIAPFPPEPCGSVGLCGISSRFQLLSPTPGQVIHVLLTRSPLGTSKFRPKTSFGRTPFDLHVLGAPPAFVLSQDQTLYKMVSKRQRRLNQFYKSFDLCFAQTQSLASCTNYFWEFFKVLSKSLKRFRSSFDIVQFSRSCLLSRSSLFIISGKCKFVKHFFDFSLSRSVEPVSGTSCVPFDLIYFIM